MKKFEEEIKGRVEIMAAQPGCSMTRKVWYKADDIHELSKDWISPEDHQAEIAKLNSKIDWLHGLLDERNEEVLQTVKRLNEAIPEIPEFVGKYIKETADPIHEMCAWAEHYGDNGTTCDDPELSKMLDWFGRNRNMFYEAVIKGYTVKEKRFYLKHIEMSKRDVHHDYYAQIRNERFEHDSVESGMLPQPVITGVTFTQSEIDGMETGSYEQIEVQE